MFACRRKTNSTASMITRQINLSRHKRRTPGTEAQLRWRRTARTVRHRRAEIEGTGCAADHTRWEAFDGMFIILSSRQSDHLVDYCSPAEDLLCRLREWSGKSCGCTQHSLNWRYLGQQQQKQQQCSDNNITLQQPVLLPEHPERLSFSHPHLHLIPSSVSTTACCSEDAPGGDFQPHGCLLWWVLCNFSLSHFSFFCHLTRKKTSTILQI